MKLYEINNAIMDCIDEETGEIIDFEKLENLNIERNTKLEQLALWYKNELADMKAYKDEEKSFQARGKAAKNKAEQIKKRLDYELVGSKFKTEKVAISFRKSEAVQIEDGVKLADEYLTIKQPEPNKTAIKNAIKSGVEITGCSLVVNQNIQIK